MADTLKIISTLNFKMLTTNFNNICEDLESNERGESYNLYTFFYLRRVLKMRVFIVYLLIKEIFFCLSLTEKNKKYSP